MRVRFLSDGNFISILLKYLKHSVEKVKVL